MKVVKIVAFKMENGVKVGDGQLVMNTEYTFDISMSSFKNALIEMLCSEYETDGNEEVEKFVVVCVADNIFEIIVWDDDRTNGTIFRVEADNVN